MNTTGTTIKEERDRRGWTQQDLAAKLSVKQHTVSRLESTSIIRTKWLVKLDKAFGGTAWREQNTLTTPMDELEFLKQELDGIKSRVDKLTAYLGKLVIEVSPRNRR